jgi:hypothetical protein
VAEALIGLVGLGFGLVVVGLLVPWTAYAGARGRLGRNGMVGTRTAATMASDAAWRAGHHAMIPFAQATAVLGGAGVVLMGLFALLWGGEAGIIAGMGAMLAQVGLVLGSIRPVNRAARRAETRA